MKQNLSNVSIQHWALLMVTSWQKCRVIAATALLIALKCAHQTGLHCTLVRATLLPFTHISYLHRLNFTPDWYPAAPEQKGCYSYMVGLLCCPFSIKQHTQNCVKQPLDVLSRYPELAHFWSQTWTILWARLPFLPPRPCWDKIESLSVWRSKESRIFRARGFIIVT